MYFLRAVTFPEKLILRSQLHDKYVRKDSSLTIIHSFKVTMSWTIFKISQFFIVESSRQCILVNSMPYKCDFQLFEYLHRRGMQYSMLFLLLAIISWALNLFIGSSSPPSCGVSFCFCILSEVFLHSKLLYGLCKKNPVDSPEWLIIKP